MAWVNETAPENRGPGFSVQASVTTSTLYSGLFLRNGASLLDIFDPGWSGAEGLNTHSFHVRSSGSDFFSFFHASVNVDFGPGAAKRIRRVRCALADSSNIAPSIKYNCGLFRIAAASHVGSHTNWVDWLQNSHYTSLQTFAVPFWPSRTIEFILNNPNSYQCYQISFIRWGMIHDGNYPPNPRTWELHSGWFETEADERAYDENFFPPASVSSVGSTVIGEAGNVIDGDYETEWQVSTGTSMLFDLGQERTVNSIEITPGLAEYHEYPQTYSIGGSNDGQNFFQLMPNNGVVHFSPVGPKSSSRWFPQVYKLNWRGMIDAKSYRYYMISSPSNSLLRFSDVKLGHIGQWSYFYDVLPHREIAATASYPMLIADAPARDVEAYSGAVTSGEEGVEFWNHRITRELPVVEALAGSIGGDYIDDYEAHVIERELGVEGFTSPVGQFDMLVRHMNGLAGFGRQGNGDITIERTVEGGVGEYGLMDDAQRSRYTMEGRTGWIGFFEREPLEMATSAKTGITCRADVRRGRLVASSLAGANASASRLLSFSGSSVHGNFSSFAEQIIRQAGTMAATVNLSGRLVVALEPREMESWAWVEAMCEGEMIRFPLTMAATAYADPRSNMDVSLGARSCLAMALDVGEISVGAMTIPLRRMSSTSTAGSFCLADVGVPVLEISAEALVDALATANVWRTNYTMKAGTSGNRFDSYLLKYEAPK